VQNGVVLEGIVTFHHVVFDEVFGEARVEAIEKQVL
jgi:hypothetical protein